MNKKQKKGVALVTVVIIMSILMILGISILGVGLAEAKNASWQKNRVQAHYLGRSGVYVGLKLIKAKLDVKNYPDLGVLVSELNSQAAALNSSPTAFKIGDSGKFILNFESTEPGVVKIKSTGSTAGTPNATEMVTYMVKINPGVSMGLNPGNWVNGINLIKGIDTSTNYLGKGVMFEGKPVQSPQGSGTTSTYQASILYFRNYTQSGKSLSFVQVQNSIPITFDAEVLYFESGVILNKTRDSIKLSISEDVMGNRISNLAYGVKVGFEDIGRYNAFIGSYTTNLHGESEGQFFPGEKYGVVYFGGPVVRDLNGSSTEPVLDAGYYYFRSGVNLQDSKAGEVVGGPYKNLVKINPDDAIIKALEALFKQSPSSEGYIWNNK